MLTHNQGGASSIIQPLPHPVIISKIDGAQNEEVDKVQITDFKQLIETGEKVSNPNFRCRFSVNATLPDINEAKSASEFLRVYDTKTGATRDHTSGKSVKASEKLVIFI